MHPAALVTRNAHGLAALVLSLLWSSLAGAVDPAPESASLFLRKGDIFFNDQRYQEAISWYEQATVADPAHAHAFTMLAAAHYMAGGVSSAMRNFDKALDIEPASLNALLRSGQLHLQVCNLDRAERDFAAIRRLEPQHKEAAAAVKDIAAVRKRLAAAQMVAEKADWDNVGDALEHVYELAPDCVDAMLLSGQARLQDDDFEGCIMEAGRVLKIQPSHVEALILRGQAHFLLEDFDMAKRHYGMVLTQYDPENERAKDDFKVIKKYQKKVAKLKAVISRRNWTEIETEVTKGLEDIEPSHTALLTELHIGLAKALLHVGRPADKVVAAADAALEHDYNEDVVIIKIKTFMRDERWEAAIQLAETTMQERGRSEKLRAALRDAKVALKKSKVKDYYKVLGVDKDVDEKTLKKVYRRLALQNHPDKAADGDKEAAEKRFADINEAYEVLSDPEKRELHDAGEDVNDPNAGRGHGHGFGQPFNFGGQTFNVRFG